MRKRFATLLLLTPAWAAAQTPLPAPPPAPAAAAAPPPVTAAAPPPVAAPPPAPAAEPAMAPAAKRDAPEPRTGFQMHFVPLAAVAFPLGSATGARGDSLSSRYSWQWLPLEVGLGAKLTETLYVGGYLNVGVGSEGGDLHTERRCDAGNDIDDDVSCSASSVHLGLELRYTFGPGERLAGFVGYGAGFTAASETIRDAGQYSETSTVQGVDWARLSGGFDFRAARGFGLGPVAIVSVGRYFHQRTEIRRVVTFSGAIDDQAFHAWLALGLRMVIFP